MNRSQGQERIRGDWENQNQNIEKKEKTAHIHFMTIKELKMSIRERVKLNFSIMQADQHKTHPK